VEQIVSDLKPAYPHPILRIGPHASQEIGIWNHDQMRESFTCAFEHFDELRLGKVRSDHDGVLYATEHHLVQRPGVADWNLFQLLVGTAIGNDRDWA
jgi:hypothetical protein